MESGYDGFEVPVPTLILLTSSKGTAMRNLIAIAFSCFLLSTTVYADSSCQAQATEKKLSGAAKNSFVKKCEKDAAAPK